MSVDVFDPRAPQDGPLDPGEPEFTVLGVEPLPHAAAPTMRFQLHVSDPEGREVHTAALSVQIQIEPVKRRYDEETRERLTDLFGAPERWGATTQSFQLARVDVLVPSFVGATSFALDLPLSYDLELAATRYFYAVPDGEVPLRFFFNGMVLYRGEQDHLQVAGVPWSCNARWGMPVEAWKRAMAAHYPGGGWIRLGHDTLAALGRRRTELGAHSYDALVAALLEEGA